MSVVWSILISGAYFLINKNKRNALVIGCAVFSHWVLDFISHAPDLPLAPGSTAMVGLGLWNSTLATILIEASLFVLGAVLYFRATKPKDTAGKIAPWTLIVFLVISYVASIISPPPPDAAPIGWMALSQWLFVPWGYWIDGHREYHG